MTAWPPVNSDVLEHAYTVAVWWSSDCADVQNAAELVENEGGQSSAVTSSATMSRVLLLLDTKDSSILNGGNLVIGHEDVSDCPASAVRVSLLVAK